MLNPAHQSVFIQNDLEHLQFILLIFNKKLNSNSNWCLFTIYVAIFLSRLFYILFQTILTFACICVVVHGWEGNRRSGVAFAMTMRHRLQWFIRLRAHGLWKGDEHPAYSSWGMAHITFTSLIGVSYTLTHTDVTMSRVGLSLWKAACQMPWDHGPI